MSVETYNFEIVKGISFIIEENNHYLLDTTFPRSISEICTSSGFHFAGKHYQLRSQNECGSINAVNAALKQAYGFDFRVKAVIGSDILCMYAIFIDNQEHKIHFAGTKTEIMTFSDENFHACRAKLIIDAGFSYKLEVEKGVSFIIDGRNYYLFDTIFPKSITKFGNFGGLYLAGNWYPLHSQNEFGSIYSVNTALKQAYGFNFRVSAVIGSDIIGEFDIFIDNNEQTVYFQGSNFSRSKTKIMAFTEKKGRADFVQLFIEAGGDVNAKVERYKTR